jgi:RNA polymerase sigma-70 factor (ECF subfamily)
MRGDTAALEELLGAVREFAMAAALSRFRDRDAADDVAQEVVWIVWRRLADLRRETALRSWLWRVIANAVRGHIRKIRSHDRRLRAIAVEHSVEPVPDRALKRLFDREKLSDVRLAATRLPPSQKAVLEMVAFEGMSTPEAARRLGVRAPTVRAHLSRARTAIRLQLGGDGRDRYACGDTREHDCAMEV